MPYRVATCSGSPQMLGNFEMISDIILEKGIDLVGRVCGSVLACRIKEGEDARVGGLRCAVCFLLTLCEEAR